MAEGNGASNTAIVAILVIVLLVIAVLYFFGGGLGEKGADHTTVIEKPNINLERPSTPSLDRRHE